MLIAAATRELTWALPSVAREVHRWRKLAKKIPDARIRKDALSALATKRSHIDGAALFSILPLARDPSLLRLLVSYEIIWDFLDSVNERSAAAGLTSGLQLHQALIDALDPARPISDYYRYSPWQDDGGYLRTLVAVCQENCACLPSYERVYRLVMREARRSRVCAINHIIDASIRDTTLQAWTTKEFPSGHDAWWFELTAATSTDLTIFALLALASEQAFTDDQMTQISDAYFPWASGLAAMLDSYVDQFEDASNGDHSYVAHYASPELAAQRICMFIHRCLQEMNSLSNSEKHTLIVTSMFAMYLSKSSTLTLALRETTKYILDSGGSLTRLLHPILRLWRTAYGLRSA